MTDVLRLTALTAQDAGEADKIAKAYQVSDAARRQKSLEEIVALQKQLDQLKVEQKQAQTKTSAPASGKSRHVAHAEGWKAVTTQPDLCKVGGSIVAFDSCATLDNTQTASPNVIARGTPVYRQGDISTVVQGDAGAQLIAGTSQGSGCVKIIEGHSSVKVNGIPVARHDSKVMVNCNAAGAGGALGKLVTEQKSVTSTASGATNPDAPPGKRTSERLERLKAAKAKLQAGQLDFNALDEYVNFTDSNKTLDGLIGQIKGTPGTAGDYAAQAARGVLGFGKDAVMGIGELAYEGIKGVPKLARMALTSNGEAISQLNGAILAENIKLGNITLGTVGQGALDIGNTLPSVARRPRERQSVGCPNEKLGATPTRH